MKTIFVPHELKTIEVDVDKKIFRINGEDFGKGCTGFRIECCGYKRFDIRVEIDTTVKFVSITGDRCKERTYKTNDPWYLPEAAVMVSANAVGLDDAVAKAKLLAEKF